MGVFRIWPVRLGGPKERPSTGFFTLSCLPSPLRRFLRFPRLAPLPSCDWVGSGAGRENLKSRGESREARGIKRSLRVSLVSVGRPCHRSLLPRRRMERVRERERERSLEVVQASKITQRFCGMLKLPRCASLF
jgi:hypothetical protein